MLTTARRLGVLLGWTAAAGLAAVVAAGCGGGGGGAGSASPSPSPTTSASSPAPASGGGSTVTVNETEFRLGLSTSTFTAGTYTFTAVNQGKIEHSLEITGPGVKAETATLSPGQSAQLHVTLQAGSYDLFCPIGSHKALGMNQEITVGGATTSAAISGPGAATASASGANAATGAQSSATAMARGGGSNGGD